MTADGEYKMLIGGELFGTAERLSVINPATGRPIASVPVCGAEELERAVEAANAAFARWREVPPAARQAALAAAADRLDFYAEALARSLTREQGKPLAAARAEIASASASLRYYAGIGLPQDIIHDRARRIEIGHVPLGAVCAISPWNFPVSLAVWKIAPALAAGNTIVVKPSPFTPLTMLKIGELWRDLFPAGVLNIVSGGDDLGPAMTAHAGFAKIAFTGATATGRLIMAAAAGRLARTTLELGGNDAAIILPDVDPGAIARKLFTAAFHNSGQVCVATKRLYVHDAIYDEVFGELLSMALIARLGDGLDPRTELGPVQNVRQFDRVSRLIADARSQGQSVHAGAAGPAEGYFIPVTLVDNPPDDAAVVCEEAFGPVLPLLRYSEVDEAVARANMSEFGLGASVWSADTGKAHAIARRLEAGTIWVNQLFALRPDIPFAGHKASGMGVENGVAGLMEYLSPQAIYLPADA